MITDLLNAARLEARREAIENEFPRQERLAVSARTGSNLDEWFARLTHGEPAGGRAIKVDYQV